MADRTSIEWTESTWTPIRARWLEADGANGKPRVGWHCEHVSEGCRNCYAESINRRLGTQLDFKPGHRRNVEIFLDETMLLAPLRWKKPRRIFVCSMTDLFADFVPDAMLDRIFAVMALCPQHTFQVLTKRPARMRAYLTRPAGNGMQDVLNTLAWIATVEVMKLWAPGWTSEGIDGPHRSRAIQAFTTWPLPNVWLGTSCEDQATADARIPELLETPAAIRFVSAEPLIGPIDFRSIASRNGYALNVLKGYRHDFGVPIGDCGRIDCIIVGGESGPRARPMHRAWARSIRDQCAAAWVAFLFKQWGEWLFEDQVRDGQHPSPRFFGASGSPIDEKPPLGPATGRLWHWWEDGGFASIRVGKKSAGRLLDGVTHDGFPEVRHG